MLNSIFSRIFLICTVTVAISPDGLHIPDLAEQLFLGEYMVRVLGQEGQKVKFLRRKVLLLAVDVDPSGSLIDLESRGSR